MEEVGLEEVGVKGCVNGVTALAGCVDEGEGEEGQMKGREGWEWSGRLHCEAEEIGNGC